jgi:hypothetical protein
MTVVINHHLVLTKREWTAVINALDFMDVHLHGKTDELQTLLELEDDLKEVFPSGFLCETSKKIATSK